MNANIIKYKDQISRLSKEFDIQFVVIGTIALNESLCNPDVKPYREKTWIYFTHPNGKPLGFRGGVENIQERALEALGQDEFEFQIHAHGAFQTVGSVLRELGYREKEMTKEFFAQGHFAMSHLSRMRNRFIAKYKKIPTREQLYGMYNGGFGSVNEDGFERNVALYIEKALKNEKQIS